MARNSRKLRSTTFRGGRVGLRNELRFALERLEPRHLLAGMDLLTHMSGAEKNSGDEGHTFWVARIDDLPGATAYEQLIAGQNALHAAGLTDITMSKSLGSQSIYLLRTVDEVSADEMNNDLSRIRGYEYVQGAEGNVQTGQLTRVLKGEIKVNPLASLNRTQVASPLSTTTGGSSLAGPSILGSFAGLNANDNPFLVSPPDTILAVGPNHVVEAVNNSLRIFDKDGNVILTQSLDDFFAPLLTVSAGDPLVAYDDMANVWYVVSIDGFNNNNLLLGVSNTSDPLDGFTEMHQIAITPFGDLADFPKIGFNADSVILEVNDFGTGGGTPRISAIDKSTLLDATPATISYYNSTPAPNFRAMVPAQMHDSAPGSNVMYFVQERGYGDGSYVQIVKMTDVLSDSPIYEYYDIDVNDYGITPIAQQPGGFINSNDTTFVNADWRNGKLVAAHAVGDFSDSDAHANWYEFDVPDAATAVPSLLQQGRLDPGDGISTYFPTVAIAAGGAIGLTYMQSSPSEYASMYVSGRTPFDVSGSMRPGTVVAAGEDFLDGFFRAGDYSGITVDPVDGSTFWAANEYKASNAFWSTAIAHFSLSMSVANTRPADGEIVASKPTQYIVDFSEPFDPTPANIHAAGLTINGKPAKAYSIVDADTLLFTFTTNPVTTQGLQTLALASNTVVRLGDADPLTAYNSTFRYDTLPMQVRSSVPADGSVATLPLTKIRIDLNERYIASSVGIDDLAVDRGTVTGFKRVGSTAIDYFVSGITNEGTLKYSLAAGVLTDIYGNPNLPFSASVTLDYLTLPFPVPTTSVDPLGSLIYETSISATINPLPTSQDIDQFTISIDPGQTISVVVEPTIATLRPIVSLNGYGISSTVTATAAGKDAVIQPQLVPSQLGSNSAPKTYTVAIKGANGTTGAYTVRLILNAAAENESYDGPTNNSRSTAQTLDSTAVQLISTNPNATRLAVVGNITGGPQPGEVYVGNRSFNFFGGSVLHYDDEGNLVQTITNPILETGVISDVELGPNNIIYVALSKDFFGSVVKGELAKFDLAGNYLGSVLLPDDSNVGYLYPFGFDVAQDGSIWVPQLNSGNLVHVDAAGNLIASYFIGFNVPQDAAVRSDGQIFISQNFSQEVLQLNPGTGDVTTFAFNPNFSALMLNFQPGGDLWLGDTSGQTRFDSTGTVNQFISNFGAFDPQVDPSQNLWVSNFSSGSIQRFDPVGNLQFQSFVADGRPLGIAVLGVDSATPLPPVDLVDYYSFTLDANSTATIAVDILSGLPLQLELLTPTGQTIAFGTESSSIDRVIDDFVATAAGKYYVKISGKASKYSLVVTKNAAFDIGDNDSIATAQPIIASPDASGRRAVLGSIGNTSVVLNAVDSGWYDQAGFHDPFNDNYFAGGADGIFELRDFFVFDSSALAGTELVSAQFRAYNPNGEDGFFGFNSSDPTETYILHGVSTPADQLLAGGSGMTGIFDDLGSGITYGSTTVSTADNGQLVKVDLSSAAVADLASKLGGPLALGGALTTLAGNSGEQTLFSGTFSFRAYSRELALQLAESDFYQVLGIPNKTIEVETFTEAKTKGEFVNTLNPYLKLYNAQGILLASNLDGASDHRNAKLSYKPPAGQTGPYFIRVGAEEGTEGEYVLTVRNTNPTQEPFNVESAIPPSGSLFYGPLADFTVNFNDLVNATTLQGRDLKIDNVAASSVSAVDGYTASFTAPYVYSFGGHYYARTSTAKTWAEAEAEAVSKGGHLVTINNAAEHAFLKTVFASNVNRYEYFWTGLNDLASEGNFVWSSGQAVTYTNWGPGEPNDFGGNEDAVILNWYRGLNEPFNGAWNDFATDQQVVGIIELNSRPSGSWVASEGDHTMSMSTGSVSDLQQTNLAAYNGTFSLDYTAPRVVATSIQPGAIIPFGDLTFTVTFSEPLQTSMVDPSDIGLFGTYLNTSQNPNSITFDSAGAVMTVSFSGLPDDAYKLVLFANEFSFVDRVGMVLDGDAPTSFIKPIEGGDYTLTFATDLGTPAPTLQLEPVDPLGSLVYQTPPGQAAAVAYYGDIDAYTITLDPGQSMTVLIDPIGAPPPTLYAANGNGGNFPGSLLKVNQDVGNGTLIGDPVTPGGLTGLDFDPSSNVFFGSTIQGNGSTSRLVRIDPVTGALLSTVGPIKDGPGGPAISIGDLAIQPVTNVLYAIRSGADNQGQGGLLYMINKSTGVATLVGNTFAGAGGGIAFAADGTLYQSAFNSFFDFPSLNTIDPANGARISTTPISSYFDGLSVRPSDGVLFAAPGGSSEEIFKIDPTTGKVTFVGFTGSGGASDLAFAPISDALAPTLEVRGPTFNLLASVVAGPGQNAVIQNLATSAAGSYTISVGGSAGTTGLYTMRLILNADLEAESIGGSPNDTPAEAQSLNSAFVDLGYGMSRAALLGTVDKQNVIDNGSFESGDFSGWTTETTGSPFVNWTVSQAGAGSGFFVGTSPQDGLFNAWNGFDGGGPMEYRMYRDVAIPVGASNPTLSWQDRIQWDFTITGSATQPRLYDVQIVDPATSAVLETVHSFSTGIALVVGDTGWQTHAANLTAYIGQSIRLHFQEFIPEAFTGPGQIEFDNIRIDGLSASYDYYSVNLVAGQATNIAIDDLVGSGAQVELIDPSNNVVVSVPANNADSVIAGYVAPLTGTYLVRVFGGEAHDYNLVVTKATVFDFEPNDSQATAISLAGAKGALGAIVNNESAAVDSDWYKVKVANGKSLSLTANVPAGGANAFVNNLVPRIEAYNSVGELIGSAEGVGSVLTTAPLVGGTYSIRVTSVGSTSGEYLVAVSVLATATVAPSTPFKIRTSDAPTMLVAPAVTGPVSPHPDLVAPIRIAPLSVVTKEYVQVAVDVRKLNGEQMNTPITQGPRNALEADRAALTDQVFGQSSELEPFTSLSIWLHEQFQSVG